MKKKWISLMLSACLLLNTFSVAALAAEENTEAPPETPQSDDAALAEWEAALGDFTVTDANAYTPTEAKDLLTAEDTGHAYDPSAEEDETITGEFVPGEVLYARKSGMLNAASGRALAALGITEETPVYTERKGSATGAPLLGSSGETVWYRAGITGEVQETVEALREIDGIVDAEPNYIYTTEVAGQASAAEVQKSWILDPGHDRGLHLGWWMRWWLWWVGLPGHEYAPFPDKLPDGFTSYDEYFAWLVEHDEAQEELPEPGKDVVVAVIDTGVDYTHQDLASVMWVNSGEIPDNGVDDDGNGYIDDCYGIDATANPRFDGKIAGDPMDYNGHGTHVAGIIAMANNGEGGVGAAYGSKIMAIKAGQTTGTFASADIAEAIQYAVAHGADVINMSFGGTGKSSLVETALEDAFSTCVLIAAAGNNGRPTTDAPAGFVGREDIYPAGYNFVIGVMATDEDGNLAGFSNWDYCDNANCEYELAAPGVDIYSTLPGNRYAEWSGTSMAAPAVAAAAAVIRAAYPDKNEYNSRFIMGQLVSATTQRVNYVDKLGISHSYAKLDLAESLEKLPKPNLRMAQVFALDNKRAGTENDGDRIIDAGETINLGVAVRNQWGKSGKITVKADALTNDIANPYVTFLTDTVELDAAGTFQTVNNGFEWDDSLLTDVSNPIRFTLREDTPNDTQIQINLTVTTTNGLDEHDTTVYTIDPTPTFTFRVQRGAAIRGHISTDTTLTADKYWIIENALLIDEGATLTVEPGTQIQFWSSDYEDAYGEKTMVYISNSGTLNMIGTEDAPIEMFPGAGFEDYVVQIFGNGVESLRYCEIINPFLGKRTNYNSDDTWLNSADHCRLTQNYSSVYYRYLSGAKMGEDWIHRQDILSLTNSTLKNLTYPYETMWIFMRQGVNNLYENCNVRIVGNYSEDGLGYVKHDETNSVFLNGENVNNGFDPNSHMTTFSYVPTSFPSFTRVFTYDGAESKYVLMKPYDFRWGKRALARAMAQSAGVALLSFQSQEEVNGFRNGLLPLMEETRLPEDQSWIISWNTYVDYCYDTDSGSWNWGTPSDYNPTFNSTPESYDRYASIGVHSDYCGSKYSYFCSQRFSDGSDLYYALEFPATLSDEEITTALNNFDMRQWVIDHYPGSLYHSAVLNPVLDTNMEHWTRFTAPNYTSEYYYPLHGNYWGTENSTLIDKMILDDDDYPGTLADIVETPILTLNDDLSMIYPFVTKIEVTEHNGSTLVDDVAPGQTVDVHVSYNRDMDTTVQPSITYGGEEPFTDYMVSGEWKNAREWVGTTKVSAVSTGGNMIFRAKGGRAASDHWLVCGTDQQRFQFIVNAASAQSAVLNATGGAGKVTLNWAQNDYELLAGYNLYRSESEDGDFVKLNESILTDESYTDTNVASGVTYYYYFTMVDTDGAEIADAKSNTVHAAPLDDVKPTVTHTPIVTAKAGQALTVSTEASDNIAVSAVTLYYRVKDNGGAYIGVPMTYNATAKRYSATIPVSAMTSAGVNYYIEARDAAGNTATAGSAAIPYVISTESKVTLLTVFPSTVNVGAAPETMTVYGTNFAEGMTVKVGGVAIEQYTLNADGTQISFAMPQLTIGAYSVSVTKDGDTVTLPSAVTCQDSASYVQLNAGTGVPGVKLELPLYAVMSGPMYALRAEIEVPAALFTAATAVAADGWQIQSSWRSGVLTISMVNARSNVP